MVDVPAPSKNRASAANDLHPRPRENRLLGLGLRIVAVLMLGIMLAGVKLAGEAGVHPVESLFWRQLAGLPVVVLWLHLTGSLSDVRTRRPWGHAIRMIVGMVGMAGNFLSVTLLPMAEATTIGFAVPLFATMLAALFLGEPVGQWRWGAVAVGFVGVLLAMVPAMGVGHDGPALSHLGMVVALIGSLGTAGAVVQIRNMGRTETSGAIVFWFSLTALIPLAMLFPFVATPHTAETWAIIALFSVAGALAQLFLTGSLRYAPVSVVVVMDYGLLIWSVLAGYWLFDAVPGPGVYIGAPVIIVAGLVIAWREQRLQRQQTVAP